MGEVKAGKEINRFGLCKVKLIINMAVLFFWYFALLFLFHFFSSCYPCFPSIACESQYIKILPSCDCCFGLYDFLLQVGILVLPLVLVNIVIAILDYLKKYLKLDRALTEWIGTPETGKRGAAGKTKTGPEKRQDWKKKGE